MNNPIDRFTEAIETASIGEAVNPIDRFTQAIETASIGEAGVSAPNTVLEATVPLWRLAVTRNQHRGRVGPVVRRPRSFEEMRRTPLPNGELVEFVHTWEKDGEPHVSHQATTSRSATD